MSPQSALRLAEFVLAVHMGVILFIVFGLVVIPLGGRLGARFVHGFWWRSAHISAMGVVALQKVFGQSCFLTKWEALLTHRAAGAAPIPAIQLLVERLIYLDLPPWVFAVAYILLFAYVLVLWFVVPPWRGPLKYISQERA